MVWIKIVMALLVLFLIMFSMGTLLSMGKGIWQERFVIGFATMLAIIQLSAIPLIFSFRKFRELKLIVFGFVIVLMLLLIALMVRARRKQNKDKAISIGEALRNNFKKTPNQEKILIAALGFVIVCQLVVVVLFTHEDADDAFYVVTAVDSVETDTMYRVEPHTGGMLSEFPVRYVLSPFPMIYALIGSWFDLSPTIVAHILLPIFVLPFCYSTIYLIGMQWFKNNCEKAVFMTLTASVLMMFQGLTTYTTGSFLLLRSWQGKSVLATIILPLIVYLFINEEKEEPVFWIQLLVVLLAGANVSSMGIMMAPIVAVVMGAVTAVVRRKKRFLIGTLLCCIPSAIYALMYVKMYAWKLF